MSDAANGVAPEGVDMMMCRYTIESAETGVLLWDGFATDETDALDQYVQDISGHDTYESYATSARGRRSTLVVAVAS